MNKRLLGMSIFNIVFLFLNLYFALAYGYWYSWAACGFITCALSRDIPTLFLEDKNV